MIATAIKQPEYFVDISSIPNPKPFNEERDLKNSRSLTQEGLEAEVSIDENSYFKLADKALPFVPESQELVKTVGLTHKEVTFGKFEKTIIKIHGLDPIPLVAVYPVHSDGQINKLDLMMKVIEDVYRIFGNNDFDVSVEIPAIGAIGKNFRLSRNSSAITIYNKFYTQPRTLDPNKLPKAYLEMPDCSWFPVYEFTWKKLVNFTITEDCLTNLKTKNVPYEVLDRLEHLRDKKFEEEKLLTTLKIIMGNKYFLQFNSLIMEVVKKSYEGSILESKECGAFPKIKLEYEGNDFLNLKAVKRWTFSVANNSLQAHIFYTRLTYLIITKRTLTLNFSGLLRATINFPETPIEDFNEILFLTSLYRKLKFLEIIFNCKFKFQEISRKEINLIDEIFRGITEGNFWTRLSSVVLPNVKLSGEEIIQPPYTAATSIGALVEDVEFNLLGNSIPVGTIKFHLNKAELIDDPKDSLIDKVFKNPNQTHDVPLAIFDHQIYYEYIDYLEPNKKAEVEQLLNNFKENLKKREPNELVNLISYSLLSPVDEKEAESIAKGWLISNYFSYLLVSAKPEINKKQSLWNIQILWRANTENNFVVGKIEIEKDTGFISYYSEPEDIRSKCIFYLNKIIFEALGNNLNKNTRYTITNILQSILDKDNNLNSTLFLIDVLSVSDDYIRKVVLEILDKIVDVDCISILTNALSNNNINNSTKDILLKYLAEMIPRSLPFMISSLSNEDRFIRTGVVQWLNKLLDSSFTPIFVNLLSSSNSYIKDGAFKILTQISNKDSIPIFEKAINEVDNEVKKQIIYIMGKIADKAFIPLLKRLFTNEDPGIRKTVLYALEKIKDQESKQLMEKALDDSDEDVTTVAIELLGENAGKECIPLVIKAFFASGDKVKKTIIQTVSKVAGRENISLFIEALSDNSVGVKIAAVHALGNIAGEQDVVQFLKPLLDDPSDGVRGVVTTILGKMLDTDDIPLFIEVLSDNSVEVRIAAFHALGNIMAKGDAMSFSEQSFVHVLKPFLNDPDENIRSVVIDILGRYADKNDVPLFLKTLSDSSIKVRIAGMHVLSNIAPTKDVRSLIEPLLSDSEVDVRNTATDILGKIADKNDILLFLNTLSDADINVRMTGTTALQRVIDQDLKLFLEELSKDTDEVIRYSAVKALSTMTQDRMVFSQKSGTDLIDNSNKTNEERSFYFKLQGQYCSGNTVIYGKNVNLVFNYGIKKANLLATIEGRVLEEIRISNARLGISLIPTGFSICDDEWHKVAKFENDTIKEEVVFHLKSQEEEIGNSGFNVVFDIKGYPVYYFYISVKLASELPKEKQYEHIKLNLDLEEFIEVSEEAEEILEAQLK